MTSAAETAYLLDGLRQNIRNDGRVREETRAISIMTDVIPSANCSVRISRSDSSVLIGIKAELTTSLSNPLEGEVSFSCEYASNCDETSSSLEHCIRSFALVPFDKTQLVVKEGALAWHLYVDCLIERSNGSMLDLIAMGLRACLSCLELPRVNVLAGAEEGEQYRIGFEETKMSRISELSLPLAISFGILGGSVFMDPDFQEESIVGQGTEFAGGLVTVFVNQTGQTCGICKFGVAPIDPTLLPGIISLAQKLATTSQNELTSALQAENAGVDNKGI